MADLGRELVGDGGAQLDHRVIAPVLDAASPGDHTGAAQGQVRSVEEADLADLREGTRSRAATVER
jgi:hypothetical protein